MKKHIHAPMSGLALNTRQRAQISILLLLLAALLVLTIWNASKLQMMMQASTEEYVKDINVQVADNINVRLQSQGLVLRILADSVSRVESQEALETFLIRKALLSGFDRLLVLTRDDQCIPSDWSVQDIPGLETARAAFDGLEQVAYVEGQAVVYAAPVFEGSEIPMVLVGIRDGERLQTLIQPQGFFGRSLTCIISRTGELIVAPTDTKPFLQLENIFQEGEDSQTIQALQRMKQDLLQAREGIFRFTAADGTPVFLAYRPLEVNNWVLLTLVPVDLISAEAQSYILRTYVIVGGIVFTFILLLGLLIHFYNAHKKRLERIAFVDPVTGGNNNASFQSGYDKLVRHAPPGSYTVALLNVKGFKLINECYGTAAGDATLRYIYGVLQRHISQSEMVARGEADNFFLCLQEHDHTAIRQRLEAMWEDVNSFNKARATPYYLMMREGAFVVDDPSLEVTIAQDRARTAYQLGGAGAEAGCAFYDTGLTKKLQTEQELNDLFDHSLSHGHFQMYLQPKVRLSDGSVAGAEALVRWQHPERGLVPPDEFIPLLERNGKIVALDAYMFQQACALLSRWQQEGRPLIPIAVNLSRQHFKASGFLHTFARIAQEYHVPSNSLELELTESIFFDKEQINVVKQSIHEMHDLGFTCSLDDFGAGFSSLGLLKEFYVDTIKLDRQFFLDISNERSRDVIGCLIDLAEKLHVHTVAEGIETPEQLSYLRQAHCDMVQGYIFSRPLPVADFEKWCEQAPFYPPDKRG